MKNPVQLKRDESTMITLSDLTEAFEGIASSRLAQIRLDVIHSGVFFDGMWLVYNEIRVDKSFHYGRRTSPNAVINKELYILISSEGGFSGDIDNRLVDNLLSRYNPDKNDIVVVGRHGANLLTQRGIRYVKYYRLPSRDQNINVDPLVEDIKRYSVSEVYYPKYITLSDQRVANIGVSAYVKELAKGAPVNDEIISDINYIFEPTEADVIDHIETAMIFVGMSQLLLQSKIAQYASRFQAMSLASQEADRQTASLHTQISQAVRYLQDERLKETLNSMRGSQVQI